MDLIRAFIESAFVHYPISEQAEDNRLPIKENIFVDVTKQRHLDLSDDHIRLIYKLYRDEWSIGPAEPNIFYSLLPFVKEVLCSECKQPRVRLEHLFRWRELTQNIGEDLLTCARMAYYDLYNEERRDFDWPSVLRTDDVDLRYNLNDGFAELHQHHKASADVFNISWLCLMNKVHKRAGEFRLICTTRNEADLLYRSYIEAVVIRMTLSKYVLSDDYDCDFHDFKKIRQMALLGNLEPIESKLCELSRYESVRYDYLFKYKGFTPQICIHASERWFLYSILKRIYEGDDNSWVTLLLWRYVVIKNTLRRKLVQNNENGGFGNFADFERKKEVFVKRFPTYSNLLIELPVADAAKYHHVLYQETRLSPDAPSQKLYRKLKNTQKMIDKRLSQLRMGSEVDYRFIYHFIKKRDNHANSFFMPRNYNVRCEVRRQAIALKGMLTNYPKVREYVVAIDAANSELFCRPEVFAQAFRYLGNTGLRKTFHVGEDFYDLADGLRAIDEAITFLGLGRGDRMGHCLALGLEVESYYQMRHSRVPVPKQNLLDNLVWLYYKAKVYNIRISPSVEMMILDKFCELSKMYCKANETLDIMDYYHMMRLRGDDPLGEEEPSYGRIIGHWVASGVDMSRDAKQYRSEDIARILYSRYHFSENVRKKGNEVCEFKVSPEYMDLIFEVQEKMMYDIEERGLVIECCPSSNYRIGRLMKYENHPIFRMNDVDPDGEHHLPVTINTDDLGIFTTSLENEYSLILLALLKKKDEMCGEKINTLHIQNWIEQVIRNGHKYSFSERKNKF